MATIPVARRTVSSPTSAHSTAVTARNVSRLAASVAMPSAGARPRAASPAAARALVTAKSRDVAMTFQSVSEKSPLSSPTDAATAATQRAAIRIRITCRPRRRSPDMGRIIGPRTDGPARGASRRAADAGFRGAWARQATV